MYQCNDSEFVKLKYSRIGGEEYGEKGEKINLWGGVKTGTVLSLI